MATLTIKKQITSPSIIIDVGLDRVVGISVKNGGASDNGGPREMALGFDNSRHGR